MPEINNQQSACLRCALHGPEPHPHTVRVVYRDSLTTDPGPHSVRVVTVSAQS